MQECHWPKGCRQWSYGKEGFCTYHQKVADGLFHFEPPGPEAASPADVLSDRQLELGVLMSNLGASPGEVRKALAKEKR